MARKRPLNLPVADVSDHSAALLVPRVDAFRAPKGMSAAGVFDASGKSVPMAEIANFFWRGFAADGLAKLVQDQAETLKGRWLFGGLCRPHFGHIITNSLGRLWAAEDCGPFDGVVFIGDKAADQTDELVTQLMAVLGIKLPHHICRVATRVENLAVAPDLFSEARDCTVDPLFADWVRSRFKKAPKTKRRRVYVTRTKLAPEMGRVLSEDVIEENFAAAGYDIVAPEQLSLSDQAETYRRASVIVGTDSSALHLAALAAPADASISVIQRRANLPQHFVNHLKGFFPTGLNMIDAVRAVWFREDGKRRALPSSMAELDFTQLHDALLDGALLTKRNKWRIPTEAEVLASRALGCPKDMTFAMAQDRRDTALQETTPKKGAVPMADTLAAPAVPVIDGLRYLRVLFRLHAAIKPEWYLEVGTNAGKSLEKANCNFVAVDPKFVFKGPLLHDAAKEMYLIQKTSDDFFASGFCERNDIKFNLAFLDGLHHYEVLLRDFMNAEKLMDPGGTIVLHDCCPSTIEMTSRSETRGAWTGDVWKTLLILLEYRPDLDIQVVNARPTGLVLIRGLDPSNRVLDDKYKKIVADYDPRKLEDFDDGLAGYYRFFDVKTPEEVLESYAD